MKRSKGQTRDRLKVLRLWTRARAVDAVPYLRSIAKSLREHWLASKFGHQLVAKLEQSERSDRDHIIACEEANRAAADASKRFHEALEEFTNLDVFCLDPAQGVALVPFRLADELAWLRFELFSPDGFVGWRYHEDPMDENRPLDQIEEQQKLTEPRAT